MIFWDGVLPGPVLWGPAHGLYRMRASSLFHHVNIVQALSFRKNPLILLTQRLTIASSNDKYVSDYSLSL
jgi:hypothetical protein